MLDDDYRRSSDLPVAGHPGYRLSAAVRTSSHPSRSVVPDGNVGTLAWLWPSMPEPSAASRCSTCCGGTSSPCRWSWRGCRPSRCRSWVVVRCGPGCTISGGAGERCRGCSPWVRRRTWRRSSSAPDAARRSAGRSAAPALPREPARTARRPSPVSRSSATSIPSHALALARPLRRRLGRPGSGWTAVRLGRLARDLDRSRTALMVDPRLMNHAGSSVRVRTVLGLPLLRLEHPTLRGFRRLTKEVIDRTVTSVLLVVLAPVLRRLRARATPRGSCGAPARRADRPGRASVLSPDLPDAAIPRRIASPRSAESCIAGAWTSCPSCSTCWVVRCALVGPRPRGLPKSRPAQRNLLVKPGMTGLWQLLGDDAIDSRAGRGPSTSATSSGGRPRSTPGSCSAAPSRTVWGSASGQR